jgi:multidomain signaling protein FimX
MADLATTQKILPSVAPTGVAGPKVSTQTLMVLAICESQNTAKRIESHMRNAGHPVRLAWVTDLEDAREAISRGTPDLLICEDCHEPAPLKDVIALCQKACPDLPVLLLSASWTQEEAAAALATGARDLVCAETADSLRHMERVMAREFAAHHHLRELRNTRLRLENFESRHLQLLAGTNDAVAHIQEGILSHVNPAFAQRLGYANTEDLVGQPLMDVVAPEHIPKVKDHLKQLSKGRLDDKPMECELRKADGGTVAISAKLTRGTVDGENFVEMLVRADATPVTAEAPPPAPPAPSEMLGLYDPLEAALQQKNHDVCTVIFTVVDEFAALEERIGYRDSEEIVVKLVEWTYQHLDHKDQVFRFGGSELVLLVWRKDVGDTEKLCAKMCAEIGKQVFVARGHEAQISLSLTAYPTAGEDPQALIKELAADTRKLSESGGKRFVISGPTAKASASEREEARKVAQIKRAIEENRLKLAYQSIASLEGDSRQHFDVLVRMLDENGKEVHAGEFLPIAEKHGLMMVIDRWVTLRALKILSKRETAKDNSSLFIKISEDTLRDAEGYLAWLAEQIKGRTLKQDELVFQLQELKAQSHIKKAKLLSKSLTDMGASVAIEHYGIGTNSAQLLEHVLPHYLKFHPSFTHKFNDKEIQRKLGQLMEISRQRSIKTIVCHVEDANVMARLWQMGVNYIQGYHVQEPEVVLLATDLFSKTGH